jgi:hypothetical protein
MVSEDGDDGHSARTQIIHKPFGLVRQTKLRKVPA